MYNLEKRKFMQKVGETPDNVGPSTYFFDSYKTFKQNVAPFLSDTERSKQKKSDYCDTFYNVVIPRHIKGGSSIRNRAKRGEESTSDFGPGPGDYDPKLAKRQPAPDPRPPCRGRLYLCTPPKAELTVPSIPTKIDENGYYIEDNGEVIKNPPDEHDTTLGPAYYNVQNTEFFGEYYRGCAWSRRYSRRDTCFDNGVPGPGSYNIPCTIGVFNERDERVREMARLFGYVPRYLDAIEMRMIKEGQPGPGTYDVDISSLKQKKSMSINPQPFISGSKRWKEIVCDTPAPGTYDVSSNKRVRVNKTPFGVDAPRFVDKVTQSPCAADYNIIQGTIQDKIAKKRQYFGIVQVPFNNSAERKMGFVSNDSYNMPSSADYDLQSRPKFPEEASGCNFRSTSRRFKDVESSYDAGPASYNITESYNKMHKKCSYNVKNVPFLTTGEKCPGVKCVSKLGPADYNKQGDMYGHGRSFGTALRFREKFDDLPGPGAYTISPVYACAVYKGIGTHNLHLRESVLRKRLRLPPCKTWEAWFKEIKKRRKLQCYKREKGNIDYVGLLFSDF